MNTSNKQLHKLWRSRFNKLVLNRDLHKCKFCNVTVDLDVHHITDRHEMPNGGYVPNNGITLCSIHHLLAERFHSSAGKDHVEGFHPNDLYKVIDSSFEKAYSDSVLLKID